MHNALEIYFPRSARAKGGILRDRLKFTESFPPDPAHEPLTRSETMECTRQLLNSDLSEDAGTALVCDDGRCGPLGCALEESGCQTFFMDPRLHFVVRGMTISEALALRDTPGVAIAYNLYADLPPIDLFVVGCWRYSKPGYVYSYVPLIRRGYRNLWNAGRIDEDTDVVVVAPERMQTRSVLRDKVMLRATHRLDMGGIHEFDWAKARRQRQEHGLSATRTSSSATHQDAGNCVGGPT